MDAAGVSTIEVWGKINADGRFNPRKEGDTALATKVNRRYAVTESKIARIGQQAVNGTFAHRQRRSKY